MTIQQHIYWHTTTQIPDDSNLTPLPDKVEVAILGGGYTGLSAARTLAKHGVGVSVLEAETIGWGASSRNGGMVLTGLKLGMQTVLKRYGRDIAGRLFQVSLDSIDTVEQIVKEENIDCGFARTGHLLTANKPKHFEALRQEAEFMEKEFGHKCKHKRMRLPGFASEVAWLADKMLQGVGFYHQKIHVLSEMNKTIACSIARAERELGYQPTVALEEGLRRSLKWCADNGQKF